MCVLLHLLICTALRAHIIVVEALYEINNYYYEQKDGFISEDFLDEEDDDSLVRTETVVTDYISIHARRRDCAYYINFVIIMDLSGLHLVSLMYALVSWMFS